MLLPLLLVCHLLPIPFFSVSLPLSNCHLQDPESGSFSSPLLRGATASSASKAEQEQARRLDAFVTAGIEGASSKSHHVPHERCFTLPLAARKQFGDFLSKLEAAKQDLNVGPVLFKEIITDLVN
jgi:hypothetical protein